MAQILYIVYLLCIWRWTAALRSCTSLPVLQLSCELQYVGSFLQAPLVLPVAFASLVVAAQALQFVSVDTSGTWPLGHFLLHKQSTCYYFWQVHSNDNANAFLTIQTIIIVIFYFKDKINTKHYSCVIIKRKIHFLSFDTLWPETTTNYSGQKSPGTLPH